MADVSLIGFIPANKKIEANPLYDYELLENSVWYVNYYQQVRVLT